MNECVYFACSESLFCCAVMSCNNAHDKRCTITVLYSSVGNDCLQDSDRVSGRNRRVGCSQRNDPSLFYVSTLEFNRGSTGLLDWFVTLFSISIDSKA